VQITKDNDFNYIETNLASGSSFFGNNTQFELTGNSSNNISAIQKTFYIPNKLIVYGPSSLNISKSSSNVFTWNPDNNYNGKIYVSIIYKSTLSRLEDSSLPSNDIKYDDEVNDNTGSYTLPSAILNSMPTGGQIDITFGRGTYDVGSIGTNKNIVFIGGTTVYNIFKLNN